MGVELALRVKLARAGAVGTKVLACWMEAGRGGGRLDGWATARLERSSLNGWHRWTDGQRSRGVYETM